jgi:hypothetical protein
LKVDSRLFHFRIPDIPNAAPTIVAFVNPSSGGGQGFNVMRDLRNFLPAEQVVDMKKGGLDVMYVSRRSEN